MADRDALAGLSIWSDWGVCVTEEMTAQEALCFIVKKCMVTHFPVRKVTAFGMIGNYCSCGVRIDGNWPNHVDNVVEALLGTTE